MINHTWHPNSVISDDGTRIAYASIGSGEDIILVGGVLRLAEAYQGLAAGFAAAFRVHLMERRGRGLSGPQGDDYGAQKEAEDLCAVQAATGAKLAFGHSYGGFAVLHVASRHPSMFRRIAVYEPGVILEDAPGPAWLGPYSARLAEGDTRGAFATMVKHAGYAPRPLTAMPLAIVRLALRMGIRGRDWQHTEELLEANLAEHQTLYDSRGIADYAKITAQTLLIGGSESPASVSVALEALRHTIPDASMEILDGLDHPAPETHPARVAACITQFFASPTPELARV